MVTETALSQFPDSKLTCLRCEAPMKNAGKTTLLDGSVWSALGLAETTALSPLEVTAAICPKCGKLEFFV